MADVCLFSSNDTPLFKRAFYACCAGWVALYVQYVRVFRPGADRRHAWLALAKNSVVSTCAVGVLVAALSNAWAVPSSHAAMADLVGVFFITYEWCDLILYHLCCPKIDLPMVLHHLMHGAMGLRMGRHCRARIVPIMLLCQELSSVLLNIRYLAPARGALHATVTKLFALSFLAIRGVLGWVPLYVMLSQLGWVLEMDVILVAAAYLLQLRWCFLIGQKIRSRW